jgi:Phospholipase A2-like domain
MGFFSDLFKKGADLISNVYHTVKNRGTTLFTNSHYIGPFNSLSPEYIRTHPPRDPVDAGALHHDFDYSRIARLRDAGKLSEKETKNLIRESDNRFLRNTWDNFKHNPWGATLGYLGIKGKTLLEDAGVLNPNQFVTAKLGGLIKY